MNEIWKDIPIANGYEARYKLHNETQFIITHREIQILLDCITNIQEENEYSNHCNEELRKKITNLEYKIERLKEELQQEKKDFKEANDYCFELKDYKSRNEKAIEYIKAGKTFDNEDVRKVVNKIQNDLLNILKGDNK